MMDETDVNEVLKSVFAKRPKLESGFRRLSFPERMSVLASVATLIHVENMSNAEVTILEWFK